ncbi:unnamed protein product [Vitrella brassicaformis CCMP3155]|uniref:ER lumen protein-retaining receptor n=1 Tax=Vitrella brassicaformis (strain CCMP3155) TaxID=1169540 RepID=A0A0G4ETV8_VITBC|nr:unnamed protein product [Vitrella brassicaformis CCMP3155]|eukprot:CEM02062.1 unnamed protein product [Vitrella brassicaformis CCMP3155]
MVTTRQMEYRRATDVTVGGVQLDLKKIQRSVSCWALDRKFWMRHQKEVKAWAAFVVVLLVCYKYFSDGGFSAILTLSSAFQCFAFVLLVVKIVTQGNCAGISTHSLVMNGVALLSRLCSTLFFNGYLPVDKSGDWVYQAADVLSLVLTVLIHILMRTRYRSTYQAQHDKFPFILPTLIAAGLAFLVHPRLNNWLPADFAWTFGLYVESLAMLPQLFMMSKAGGEVEALNSHFVASVAASRFLAFLFWVHSYTELGPRRGKGFNYAGWGVLVAFGTQLLALADFLYHYINSIRLGRALIIPEMGV